VESKYLKVLYCMKRFNESVPQGMKDVNIKEVSTSRHNCLTNSVVHVQIRFTFLIQAVYLEAGNIYRKRFYASAMPSSAETDKQEF